MTQNFDNLEQNSVLDEDIENMLFPLHLMDYVLLQPKYRVVRGSLKQNNVWSHSLWLVGFTCVTLINLLRLHPGNFTDTMSMSMSRFMFIAFCVDALLYITFCALMCALNAYQTKNNVLLILKIQRAYSTIATATTHDLKKHRNNTWFCIIAIICVYLFFLEGNRQFGLLNTLYALYVISLLYFDGNIVFATRIINLLVYEVKLWSVEMDRFYAVSLETNHEQLMNHLDEVTRREDALFKAWIDITEAFDLCGKIFHLPILMCAVQIFVHPLMYIQMFIELSKTMIFFYDAPLMTAVSILVLVSLVTKNLVLLVSTCAASEKFAQACCQVDQACIRLCLEERPDCVGRLCKNVRRVLGCARARGLRAGGLLAVDAALPVRLLALLVTYTVVLLQFAFL